MVVGLMQNNNKTNSDNPRIQPPNGAARQAKIPDERTSEAGYEKLPLKFRPKAGRAQRDPMDYDSHPYPSMKQFAEFLVLRFDTPRTRHSYYRQMRLVHELCACDPALITEELYRSYILHVKIKKNWKPKTIRQAAATGRSIATRCSFSQTSAVATTI
jgi:hypothetical protein